MAEVFGIVSGAFGVTSLALELLTITRSAQHAWRRVQSLPSTSNEIAKSLSHVEQLLTVIGTLNLQGPALHSLLGCLQQCREPLKKVQAITQDIERYRSAGKLKSISGAFRSLSFDEKLSEARAALRETIDDLSFVLLVLQL